MKRPTRNMLLLAAFMAGCLVLGNVLPDAVRLPFVLSLMLLALLAVVIGRHFFIGRRHMKKKRWVDALLRFQQFEDELLRSPWKRRLSWLAAGLYTSDPIAIARNNVGVVHLNNDKLDLAESAFRSALERDVEYAVPHLNLAVVAAKRGQSEAMELELKEAARLGLPNEKAHGRVRAVLKALNEVAGIRVT